MGKPLKKSEAAGPVSNLCKNCEAEYCFSPPVRKDSNPKAVFGDAKPSVSALPNPVMYELGLALMEGALKYGRHNWRKDGVRFSTYYDACRRHLDAWWEGEDIDDESGLSHLVKAIACLTVVRDCEIMGLTTDDRPPRPPKDWLTRLHGVVTELKERHPNPKPPCIHEDQTD